MTTHARALDLSAASPPFPLEAAEDRELRDHLRSCPGCAARAARMRADLDAVGHIDPAISARLHDRIREAAVTSPRTGPSAVGIVAILVLLAVGILGASVGVGAFLAARPTTPAGPSLPPAANGVNDVVRWQTDIVTLAATDLEIDANGLRFVGATKASLASDPGNLNSWTLEATWNDLGREQRLNLYFAADATAWWIREIRVYDGAPNREAKWATFGGGPWARTPLGSPFQGDLDVQGTSATGPVELHLAGLRIAVRPQDTIMEPIGGGIRLTDATNPFRPGGTLYCSGILALPPADAELRLLALGYKLSWRWQYQTSRFAGGASGYAEVRDRAPATGYISSTATGDSGELIVFVEDPARPMGQPYPAVPEGCASPAP